MPAVFTSILLIIHGFLVKKINVRGKKLIEQTLKVWEHPTIFLIAIVNLVSYWIDFFGIVSMFLTVLLLVTGAYFTRYLPAFLLIVSGMIFDLSVPGVVLLGPGWLIVFLTLYPSTIKLSNKNKTWQF